MDRIMITGQEMTMEMLMVMEQIMVIMVMVKEK